jgi:hypothetical protein
VERDLTTHSQEAEAPLTLDRLKPAYTLSTIIVVLATVASAGGVLKPDLYRDNALVKAAWFGNDWVTLLVAVPGLVAALLLMGQGSQRARLVWLGLLDYMLYNYAFYLFGAAFNAFFLVYATLFAASIYALIFSLSRMDVEEIRRGFSPGIPVRWISGYMLLTAASIGGLWIAMSLGFVVSGNVPEAIRQTEHPTGIVFALDLTLLVPALVLGAVWLWHGRAWGYVIAAMLNVKGALYTLALTVASVTSARAGIPGAAAQIPIWACFTVASTAACLALLINLKRKGVPTRPSLVQRHAVP